MTHCIIIGSTRCGTTSLYNYLAAHPRIRVAKGGGRREVAFFVYAHRYREGIDWYWQQFPANQKPVSLESSPLMLHHRLSPQRLKAHIPDCKLVVCMRNPADRAYSDWHLARRNRWTTRSFQHDVTTEAQRLAWEEEVPGFWEEHYYLSETHLCGFLDRGLYAWHLQRWLDHFPREQMTLVKSEAMFVDPRITVGTIWDWLGLDQSPMPRFRQWQRGIYDPMSKEARAWLDAYYERPNKELERLTGWTW